MTPEEARKKFLEAKAALEKERTGPDPVPSAAGEAFVGGTKPTAAMDELPDLSKTPSQDITGIGVDIGGGMLGENLAVKAISKLPIPEKYKLPAEIVARAAGGGAGAGTADLTWQNIRRLSGSDGAPDTFEESAAMSAKAAMDQSIAGVYGMGLSKMSEAAGSKLKAVDPERLSQMVEMRDRLKAVYEKIGGQPLVEDMRGRWNPMRVLKPLETELDNQDVVRRLTDQGLDPKMARKVALQGGLTTGELIDNVPYSVLQSVAEGSFSSKKYMQNYKGTRGRMYQLMLDDLSNEFGQALPEEKVGKAIANAVDGNYNLDNAVITHGLTEVQRRLPPDFTFDTSRVKGVLKRGGFDPEGPASLIIGKPGEDPRSSALSFDQVMQARSSLSTMAHDEGADPKLRDEAQRLIKTLDKSVSRQMPGGLENYYSNVTGADDQLNRDSFRTQFTQGLLGTKEGYRKYAQYLLKNADVGNFDKMAKAVGPDEANKVRRSISEIVTNNAVGPDGQLNPQRLDKMLNEHGKYGRYFLESTLGSQWTNNVDRLKGSMEMINTAAKGAGLGEIGLGVVRYAPAAKVMYGLFNGTLDKETVGEAALLMTAPALVARVLTNPKATANVERLAGLAAAGKNPHTFARLTARTMEAIGATPEELAAMTGNEDMTRFQKMRRDLGEGKLPTTGNPMVDLMTNPGQALSGLGSQQIPGR